MFGILKVSLEQTKEENSCQKTWSWNRQTKSDYWKKEAYFIHEVKSGKYYSFLNRCYDTALDHRVFMQRKKDCRAVLGRTGVEINQTETPGL